MKKILLTFLLALTIGFGYGQSDNCSDAQNLATLGSPFSNTTIGAANDFSFCVMGSAADRIYYYDLPNGSTLTIGQTVNGYDSRHSLRYGGACPGTTEIVCTDDSDTKIETWQNCTGSLQRVYWIQSGYDTGEGTYTISWSVVAGTCPIPPTNDECTNAIPLTVDATCNYANYTNELATASVGAPAPGCANYLGGDVWFSAVVPANGHLIIDTQTGVMTDGGMAIYSGACGSLTLIQCDDDGSANGLMPMIDNATLTPGSTVYIRVWGYGNNNNGTFGICATTPACAPFETVTLESNANTTDFEFYAGTTMNLSVINNGVNNCTGNIEYRFQFSEDGGTTWVTIQNWSTTATCSHIPTMDTRYRVRERCSDCTATIINDIINVILVSCSDGIQNGDETGIDCGGSTCAACPPGMCADQTIASIPFNQTGMTTNGFGDDYSNTDACLSSYMNGDEYIFDYTPSVDECINITLSNTDTWTGIFVTDNCPDIGTCIASNTNSGGNPSILNVNLTAGITYYFTVSTFPSPQFTPFDISISLCGVPTCFDGVQNGDETGIDCGGSTCPECPITGSEGCDDAMAICSDASGVGIDFAVAPTGITAPVGQCSFLKNPTWWYFQIEQLGYIEMEIISSCGDVDFACYGPFDNVTCEADSLIGNGTYEWDYYGTNSDACEIDELMSPSGNLADAAYTIDWIEILNINPINVGEYYILIIGNYAGCNGNITLDQTNFGVSGAGLVNCDIVSSCVISSITATTVNDGSTYTVSGDINFTTPPSDGTLKICEGGNCQTFIPPFISPQPYSLTGLTSDGLQHDLTATFTSNTVNCDKIGTHTAPISTLPVDFLTFEYDCSRKILNWSTASETNNDFYTIKVGSSYNHAQLMYETEYTIQGNGNTNSISEYNFDLNVNNKYVELWQTDFDGTTVLLSTIFVSCSDVDGLVVTLAPNPTDEEKSTKIIGDYKTIKVFDIAGKEIFVTIINNQITGLSSGIYIVVIDGKYKIKLIIK